MNLRMMSLKRRLGPKWWVLATRLKTWKRWRVCGLMVKALLLTRESTASAWTRRKAADKGMTTELVPESVKFATGKFMVFVNAQQALCSGLVEGKNIMNELWLL